MEYQGPEQADLAHVHALNRAFLGHFLNREFGRDVLLPTGMASSISGMRPTELERMSRAPFLLFTVRERDDRVWQRLFEREPVGDLFDSAEPVSAPEMRFICAAVAFLWGLAQRNPYALRCVSGAGLAWCENLAEALPTDLVSFASQTSGLLDFRRNTDAHFWKRMTRGGASAEHRVRRAARLTALQSVLRSRHEPQALKLRSAACAMPMPALSVADKQPVSKTGQRGYNTRLHESPVDKKPRKNLRKR